MTDGDGSHSSERRLDTRLKGLGLNLFSLLFYFIFYLFYFSCSLALCLHLFSCLFSYQWGLIPRMGKTRR
jgi:hypothetical protein